MTLLGNEPDFIWKPYASECQQLSDFIMQLTQNAKHKPGLARFFKKKVTEGWYVISLDDSSVVGMES